MHTSDFEYNDENTLLQGYYAYDEATGSKDQKPVVLITHDWTGCNDFVKEKAKKIASLGYLGFAIDMYGKGKVGQTKEEKLKFMTPLKDNRNLLRQRIQAAFTAAKKLPKANPRKMAAMGFCFGGLCVLDLARSGVDLKGAVSFHGLLSAPEGLKPEKISAKILVLHGYADPMVKPEQVNDFAQEMTQSRADWQVHMYGHVMHGFTNPEAHDPHFGTVYDKKTDERAWLAMKNFFEEVFV